MGGQYMCKASEEIGREWFRLAGKNTSNKSIVPREINKLVHFSLDRAFNDLCCVTLFAI